MLCRYEVCRLSSFMSFFYDPADILEPAKLSGKFTPALIHLLQIFIRLPELWARRKFSKIMSKICAQIILIDKGLNDTTYIFSI